MDYGSVRFCRDRPVKENNVDGSSSEKCMARRNSPPDFSAQLLMVGMSGYEAYLASDADDAS